jgi:hypothetical protein
MTTNSGIRWLGEEIRQVELPNGRKIKLASREGADDFIDTVGTDFISTNLTATDDHELAYAYTMLETVSVEASPKKIAAGFPESELRTFVEHTRDTLKTLSTDRTWLRSGTVSMCHDLLLQVVASFSNHPSFLKILLSDEGMEAVAKFYASRKKNDNPSHSVAHSIIRLVSNAIFVLTQEGVNGEKVLGIIEKTGLLGQILRCVHVDTEFSAPIVTCLQRCLQFVKKKLKSGTRTGDILDAVIAGKDGPVNEKAKSALIRLQTLARLSNNNENYDDNRTKMCRHCEKYEAQMGNALLMKCQRCKAAHYCSKDCQVADWKRHKKMCKTMMTINASEDRSGLKASRTALRAIIESNYFDILKEVYKKTQEYNVPKKELLLEIDFYEDAPALRNEFKVWLTSDFFGESAFVDAPDWFRTDADKKSLGRFLREEYQRVTSDDLLVVCRFASGMTVVQRLRFPVKDTDNHLLSDEAVESIGREDYVRMVACLGKDITTRYFDKRSGLR